MAKIIKTFDLNEPKKICNICTSEIDENLIILMCNPNHFFCYDCIKEWYVTLKKKIKASKTFFNEYKLKMCPICRKNGGLIPTINDEFIKDVHTHTQLTICNAQLVSKDKKCTKNGYSKYNNMCLTHFKKFIKEEEKKNALKNIEENTEENVKENVKEVKKSENICGAKLKTKMGVCNSIGKEIYNGFCGRHKNCKKKHIELGIVKLEE